MVRTGDRRDVQQLRRQLRKPDHLWSGDGPDLRARVAACGVGENRGHGLGRHRLDQPVLNVQAVATDADRDLVGSELVELAGLYRGRRHGALRNDVLLCPLGDVVAEVVEGWIIDTGDRQEDEMCDVLRGAGVDDVARRGGQRFV